MNLRQALPAVLSPATVEARDGRSALNVLRSNPEILAAGIHVSHLTAESWQSWIFRGSHATAGPVAIKLFRKPDSGFSPADEARASFRALERVERLAKGEPALSCARPLFLFEDDGILVTEWLEGPTIARLIQYGSLAEACGVAHRSGEWLARLHLALGVFEAPLNAAYMMEQLEEDISPEHPIRTVPALSQALDLLRATAAGVGSTQVMWSQSHGDYKPKNLIMTGDRLAAVDVGLRSAGPCMMDSAYYLNHVALRFSTRLARNETITRIESAFCDGITGLGMPLQAKVLAWIRLHHGLRLMLHYRNWSRPWRGLLTSMIGQRLVRRLTSELSGLSSASEREGAVGQLL